MSVSGDSVTEATISSLMSSTTYYIQVAAVNSVGIGPGVYSDAVFVTPDSECRIWYAFIHMYVQCRARREYIFDFCSF